jgi:HAE1 family hydrophobic/amphiphilic exporter-1
MVVMFGWVALQTIPIQLTPDVNQPLITITTSWPGAAPAEIEREIVNRQEDVLKGITGLAKIDSSSQQGQGTVTLEFDMSTNMDRALLIVSNRLDRVADYPDEADEPSLQTAGAEDQAIAWFILTRLEGNDRPIHEYGDLVEDVIKDRIERVAGVGDVTIYGGSEREVHVVARPALLARYGLTVSDVVTALRNANSSLSAGDVDEGKRRYVVRTQGELDTVEAIRAVVLRSMRDEATGRTARVTVGDIAEVSFGYKEPDADIRMMGMQALAFAVKRETGANVIETMAGIAEAARELDATVIPENGLKLSQAYDETVYINSSVDLVQQNIWVGGTFAAIILLLFLRSFRATLIVTIAIPVSVVGSFVAMAALGRSINVISLAGLAFAVGMVVDAAIVVLENIYRLRESGMPAHRAAYEGARQVWGAILVSALTTVMVFIPILVMELEVGQLFRDIAVAISVSVLLSLLVAITVLPALANSLLSGRGDGEGTDKVTRLHIPGLDNLAGGFVAALNAYTRLVIRSRTVALLVVAGFSVGALVAAWSLLPKLEYLPEGNRNLMFGVVIPPPGYNLDTMSEIARRMEDATRHLWVDEDNVEAAGASDDAADPPRIERIFFVVTRASTFIGASALDPARAAELSPILTEPVFAEPGTFAIVSQLSLFARGIGGGRKIELDVSGPELEVVLQVAGQAAGIIGAALPRSQGHQFRPQPGLELGAPEIRVFPDRTRLADAGVTATELGLSIDAFNDGLRVAEVTVGSDRLDLMLMGPRANVEETHGIAALPVVTSNGQILPASSLATISLTAGPTEIRHRERSRTVTLEVVPSALIALEQAIEMINEQVIAPMRDEGLPAGVTLRLSGTADKLSETWGAMVQDLLLAIVIVYLVMAVLFESFIYPLIILLAVPLAAAGGVAGLALLNATGTFQPLDMLTMLGFVILVGIVVNNAILLIHQTLLNIRDAGMDAQQAIIEATRNRIRPIFMSTLTSVFGMLPLVVMPGAGSELYRGLGSVVVGGLALSALLTLVIVPPMMAMVVQPLEARAMARRASRRMPGEAAPAE